MRGEVVTHRKHKSKDKRMHGYRNVMAAAEGVVRSVGGFGTFSTWGQKKTSEITAAVLKLESALHRIV